MTLRAGLPQPPPRVAKLPTHRGYPVPWFVATIDGEPDFRVIGPGKLDNATRFRRCWICGHPLGRHVTYVVGPMCAVNRVSAEPPSHRECADYAARACPFLARPHMVRREGDVPEGAIEPAGNMLPPQPRRRAALDDETHRAVPRPRRLPVPARRPPRRRVVRPRPRSHPRGSRRQHRHRHPHPPRAGRSRRPQSGRRARPAPHRGHRPPPGRSMRLDHRYCPLVLVTERWWIETGLRLGPIRATLRLEWADRWEEYRPRPYAQTDLRISRLHAWARIGGFWRSDEDGDLSSLFNIGATFSTYGIRNIICRARGHVPHRIRPDDDWVFCDRCHETLAKPPYPGPGPRGDGGLPLPDDERLAA